MGQEEHEEARASSYVILNPNPLPPAIECTCPEMAPGLTMGSARSSTRRPGHGIRKNADVGAAVQRAARKPVRRVDVGFIFNLTFDCPVGSPKTKVEFVFVCKERV